MSLLITVYQCDNCLKIAPLKTDDDFEFFLNEWFDGWKYQFCPDCKERTETLAKQLEEDGLIETIVKFRREEKANVKYAA